MENGAPSPSHMAVWYFFDFYIKLLWWNFNGRVYCSEATLWPSEYICGRLEWALAVWYATRSPLTAAPRWICLYVQPILIVPHFVWQKWGTSLMASDSCISPQWGQTHAQSLYLCHSGWMPALTECLKKRVEIRRRGKWIEERAGKVENRGLRGGLGFTGRNRRGSES